MSNFLPDEATVVAGLLKGQAQLVHFTFPSDLETPVATYLKLAKSEKYSFLFESVEGGLVRGRYSIMGIQPDIIWKHEKGDTEGLVKLRALVKQSELHPPAGLPPMAGGGLFGYLGYDFVRASENIPDTHENALGVPDALLFRPSILVVFDSFANSITLTSPIWAGTTDPQAAYQAAIARLKAAHARLVAPQAHTPADVNTLPLHFPAESGQENQGSYKATVECCKEFIRAGDAFQVVPSHRFSVPFALPSTAFYRSLRRLNPSPFLFHLKLDDFAVVGSSPEILVRVRDNTVTIRPLAGTRPRGKTPEEDAQLAAELLADQKELAEHLMLLDLGRNDVGRVAEIGTVKPTEQFVIERYSHVMHITSNVQGQLRSDCDAIDALMAGFPAGTVSGAPKIRAMEIIDELEPVRRGIYGGAVGYVAGNGTLDTCIALRTAVIKDNKLYIQAGAGIVADSNPEAEWQETLAKGKALLKAAEQAPFFTTPALD